MSFILPAMTLLPMLRFMEPPNPVTWSVKAWTLDTTTVPSWTGRRAPTVSSPL